MTQSAIIPRVRTGIDRIHAPISRCGDHWWESVRIRSAHKSIDQAFRTLTSLGDRTQVDDCDTGFTKEISADLSCITAFIENNASSMGPRQRKNIKLMLQRTEDYIAAAESISRLWASGFSTPNADAVPAWPLNGSPQGQVSVAIEKGHERDCEKWKKLVVAGLRNLRCAEEVAKKASIRARNKEISEGRKYGAVSMESSESAPASGHEGVGLKPHSSLHTGDISLDGGSTVQKSTAPAEKSDNTMLLVGAAAVGMLLLSKK